MSYSEWCPRCGAKIVRVTRGIPSIGTCQNNHMTDRRDVLRRDPKIDDRDTAIAAAYEVAVQRVESIHAYAMSPSARLGFTATKDEAVDRIRALIPAEALAARDADRARVRREALEEAAKICANLRDMPDRPSPHHSRSYAAGHEAACIGVSAAIRATIKEEGNG